MHLKKMTERDIQSDLASKFQNQPIRAYNFYWDWEYELDFLYVTNSDYCYEFEIKLSRSDFKADFKKKDKHLKYSDKNLDKNTPNYFYYVCYENMISVNEIPEYAGLYYIYPPRTKYEAIHGCTKIEKIKGAKKINNNKITLNMKIVIYKAMMYKAIAFLHQRKDDQLKLF